MSNKNGRKNKTLWSVVCIRRKKEANKTLIRCMWKRKGGNNGHSATIYAGTMSCCNMV